MPDIENTCILDDQSLEKARVELNEDPKERVNQIRQLQDWVKTQRHLICNTDPSFMLLFLRRCKFSQLAARKMLEDFLTLCTEIPEWFRNIDPMDPKIRAVYSTGHIIPLPNRDSEGRKIILMKPGALDPKDKRFGPNDGIRSSSVIFSQLQKEDMNQVNGYVMVFDYTGFTTRHMTYLGVEMIKKSTKFFQDNFPARFKALHYYNTGPVFDAVMNIVRPFMSQKIKDRIHTHGDNLEGLYKYVPETLLPEEYVPDDYTGPTAGTTKEILANFEKRILDPKVRAAVIRETSEEMLVDYSKRPAAKTEQATFRKLNVD